MQKTVRKPFNTQVSPRYSTRLRPENSHMPWADTMWRRDRHDIMAEILETARGGLIKTHIMYKAKLSYAQMNEYLPILLEKGFLETQTTVRHRKTKTVLKTSELGEDFLRNFRTLRV